MRIGEFDINRADGKYCLTTYVLIPESFPAGIN